MRSKVMIITENRIIIIESLINMSKFNTYSVKKDVSPNNSNGVPDNVRKKTLLEKIVGDYQIKFMSNNEEKLVAYLFFTMPTIYMKQIINLFFGRLSGKIFSINPLFRDYSSSYYNKRYNKYKNGYKKLSSDYIEEIQNIVQENKPINGRLKPQEWDHEYGFRNKAYGPIDYYINEILKKEDKDDKWFEDIILYPLRAFFKFGNFVIGGISDKAMIAIKKLKNFIVFRHLVYINLL
jgi:hypothetical protein